MGELSEALGIHSTIIGQLGRRVRSDSSFRYNNRRCYSDRNTLVKVSMFELNA
jgi:hypothetical protein